MTTFMYSLLSGLVSGIVASLIVQLIVYCSKPKIVISKEIAKSKNVDNDKYEYRVKIINKSHFYAKELSVQANIIYRENEIDGTLLLAKPLKLARNDIAFIEPYNRKDSDSKYAIRIRIDKDLDVVWAEDKTSYLEVKIFCINEMTGAGRVFSQEYMKKSLIKEGSFEVGRSMKITK